MHFKFVVEILSSKIFSFLAMMRIVVPCIIFSFCVSLIAVFFWNSMNILNSFKCGSEDAERTFTLRFNGTLALEICIKVYAIACLPYFTFVSHF